MTALKTLDLRARHRLSPEFLRGETAADIADLERPFQREGRVPKIEPLLTVVDEAMRRHPNREDSDAWLAPRVHACLRLTRREAADRSLWMWLAVVQLHEYVRWRFPGDENVTPLERFAGSMHDQALARLWWGAELTRSGGDYRPAVEAFAMQDIPSTWHSLHAFHHRPLAVAAVKMLKALSSDDINRLSTALNHSLTTIVLASVVPNPPSEPVAIAEWIAEEPDETLMLDELPAGPQEPGVSDEDLAQATELLRDVAGQVEISVAA